VQDPRRGVLVATGQQTKHDLIHKEGKEYIRTLYILLIEGSLEVKLRTVWTDEKQSRAEAERRERLEERRVEEKE
jgi:hypothetical protein